MLLNTMEDFFFFFSFLDFVILVNNYVKNISDCLKSNNLDELPIVPKS